MIDRNIVLILSFLQMSYNHAMCESMKVSMMMMMMMMMMNNDDGSGKDDYKQ